MTIHELGVSGEDAAAEYLRARGYTIISRRFRRRTGEVDLICSRAATDSMDPEIVFVEVKTRSAGSFGTPEAAVDYAKRRRIRRTAEIFLEEHNLNGISPRVDVIAVRIGADGSQRIDHVKDAVGIYDGLNVDPHREWRSEF